VRQLVIKVLNDTVLFTLPKVTDYYTGLLILYRVIDTIPSY